MTWKKEGKNGGDVPEKVQTVVIPEGERGWERNMVLLPEPVKSRRKNGATAKKGYGMGHQRKGTRALTTKKKKTRDRGKREK